MRLLEKVRQAIKDKFLMMDGLRQRFWFDIDIDLENDDLTLIHFDITS